MSPIEASGALGTPYSPNYTTKPTKEDLDFVDSTVSMAVYDMFVEARKQLQQPHEGIESQEIREAIVEHMASQPEGAIGAETIAWHIFGINARVRTDDFEGIVWYLGDLCRVGVLIQSGKNQYRVPKQKPQESTPTPQRTPTGLSVEQVARVAKNFRGTRRKRSRHKNDGGYAAWEADRRWLDDIAERGQPRPFN